MRALVLIDIQNDYFAGGMWPVEDVDRVSTKAAEVLVHARKSRELAIHIKHEAISVSAPFFRPCTIGAEIHPSVAPKADEVIIIQHRPNSFLATTLHHDLQEAGITHLTLICAMTQMCIDATARAARDMGYDVTLIADACRAKATEFGAIKLTSSQVQTAYLSALGMSYATII
jgi:nicotinamidase-related amidase